jgi:Ni,Fe-hydrogenase I large subunit
MIHPDIAVALVKAGLATLNCTAGAVDAAWLTANNPSTATIVSVYTEPTATITGAILGHVLGLKAGISTMDRLRARAVESLYLVQEILGLYTKPVAWGAADSWAGGWIGQLIAETGGTKDVVGSTWTPNTPSTSEVKGWGGTEAPRGALMHQVTINGGKITKYQCIVPTTWNGSPKDTAGNRGAIEQACIGAPFDDAAKNITGQGGATIAVQGGVEILRIAQSFDPCIACAVH